MKAVSKSQKGDHSPNNEDAFFAMPGVGVFAVADGVGGGPSGELASRTVVETLQANLSTPNLNSELIADAIHFANARVYALAEAQNLRGMASTLVLAWCLDKTVTCFSIGDSRIYRFRQGELRRLTEDHVKQVTREAKPPKMMVTRAIGIKETVDIDIREWDRELQDVFVLMSDGVSDPLQDDEIGAILAESRLSMMDKTGAMIRASESRGCTDDKTVVLAFV